MICIWAQCNPRAPLLVTPLQHTRHYLQPEANTGLTYSHLAALRLPKVLPRALERWRVATGSYGNYTSKWLQSQLWFPTGGRHFHWQKEGNILTAHYRPSLCLLCCPCWLWGGGHKFQESAGGGGRAENLLLLALNRIQCALAHSGACMPAA